MIFSSICHICVDLRLPKRKDPSITSQEIANYISVALAVALSVYVALLYVEMLSLLIRG